MLRRTLMLSAAGTLAAPALLHAQAEWSPSRQVTFIVPLGPGSTADMLARTLAEVLRERLGQPVVVENRPAAGGIQATEQLKNATPDGHTIGLASQGTLVFNTFLHRDLRYNALTDFTHIAPFAVVTNALVVPPNSPFRTPADIAAAARANPGRVTYSSGGVGTSHHISMALFGLKTGTQLEHVPYRTAPLGIQAVMTGEVQTGNYNIPTVLAQINAGTLRAVGVTSRGRSEFLPTTPSLHEQGIADYDLTTWMGMVLPAGAAAPIAARYAAEVNRALAVPEVWQRLVTLGFERIERMDPAGFRAFIARDLETWGPVIRQAAPQT
jgi:tripartite-type tricarboxylate transporter receptor subunit TctC